MADYMQSVNAILQQVNTSPEVKTPVSIWWYVVGVGVVSMVALKLLSPSCVMAENSEGISEFSSGKALLFALLSMGIAYYLLSKMH
jgi:hypothetical protein